MAYSRKALVALFVTANVAFQQLNYSREIHSIDKKVAP